MRLYVMTATFTVEVLADSPQEAKDKVASLDQVRLTDCSGRIGVLEYYEVEEE